MDIKVVILGMIAGFMVGLTGMGGGALMTSALILLGLARPIQAVRTDLIWSAITKGFGSAVHFRQRKVDTRIVKRLLIRSIPGAFVGIGLVAVLKRRGFQNKDDLGVMTGRALRPLADDLPDLLSYRLLHNRLTEGFEIASRDFLRTCP